MADKFTDIKIYPVANAGNLVANGKVTICGVAEVSFRIMNSKNGQFVSLPSRMVEKDGKKDYYPEVRLLSKEDKAELDQTVMAAMNAGTTATPSTGTAKKSLPF